MLKVSRPFWATQLVVVGLIAWHVTTEKSVEQFHNVPNDLLWVPMIFAAWKFGMPGCFAQPGIIRFRMPHVLINYQGMARFWEFSEILPVIFVSLVFGFIVERRTEATRWASCMPSMHARFVNWNEKKSAGFYTTISCNQ